MLRVKKSNRACKLFCWNFSLLLSSPTNLRCCISGVCLEELWFFFSSSQKKVSIFTHTFKNMKFLTSSSAWPRLLIIDWIFRNSLLSIHHNYATKHCRYTKPVWYLYQLLTVLSDLGISLVYTPSGINRYIYHFFKFCRQCVHQVPGQFKPKIHFSYQNTNRGWSTLSSIKNCVSN